MNLNWIFIGINPRRAIYLTWRGVAGSSTRDKLYNDLKLVLSSRTPLAGIKPPLIIPTFYSVWGKGLPWILKLHWGSSQNRWGVQRSPPPMWIPTGNILTIYMTMETQINFWNILVKQGRYKRRLRLELMNRYLDFAYKKFLQISSLFLFH